MRQEKSDKMFIKWSEERNKNEWDVTTISNYSITHNFKHGLDVGGGIGKFANLICDINKNIYSIDVVDPSKSSAASFLKHPKTKLIVSDLKTLKTSKRYDFIIANLDCHHVVSKTNSSTIDEQTFFLKKYLNY